MGQTWDLSGASKPTPNTPRSASAFRCAEMTSLHRVYAHTPHIYEVTAGKSTQRDCERKQLTDADAASTQLTD